MNCQEKLLTIENIPTHIYQLGDVNTYSKSFIIIPGNPGLGGFYIPFADELYRLFNEKIFVLVISQAGHSPAMKHCFTLNEQIEHKLSIIEQILPRRKNQRLILIGHSIGAYMLLKIFDRLSDRIDRAFLLFPTIERMRESEAGKRFLRFYPLLIYLLPFLCFLINILLPFKRRIISMYFVHSPEQDRKALIDTVQYDLLNSSTMTNVLQMANEEMSVVQKRPDELIERYLDRLTFYYGENDHWVPNDVIEQMKTLYPQGDIHCCTNRYLHAFVLRHSKELANFVFSIMMK